MLERSANVIAKDIKLGRGSANSWLASGIVVGDGIVIGNDSGRVPYNPIAVPIDLLKLLR